MNFLKRTLSLITVLLMLSNNVYAEETKSVSFLATKDGDNISVVKSDLTSEVDNSELIVKVVKYVDDVETIVYQGPLGGYDNGLWNFTDFSQIQFMVIFNWEAPDDGGTYIIPIEEAQTVKTTAQESYSLSNNNSDCYEIKSIEFKDAEGMSCDGITANGCISSVELTKTSETAPDGVLLLVSYRNGRMEDFKVVNVSSEIDVDASVSYDVDLDFGNDVSGVTVKAMLWESLNSLKPLSNIFVPSANNASSSISINIEDGNSEILTLEGYSVENFDDIVYTVNYNSSDVDLVDCVANTPIAELEAGIYGNIEIITNIDGVLRFKRNTEIPNGKVWSGVVNRIRFVGKKDSATTISVNIEREG